jgi:hypothetical protein
MFIEQSIWKIDLCNTSGVNYGELIFNNDSWDWIPPTYEQVYKLAELKEICKIIELRNKTNIVTTCEKMLNKGI